MNSNYIDIEDISFSYNGREEVLKALSLRIGEGESVGIAGANGAGKSTLLKLLCGLELPSAGRICIGGLQLEKKTLPEIRKKAGYVFQDSDSQLFMGTVEEDIAFGPRNYALPEDEVEKRVAYALEKTEIEHLRKKSTRKLSGGEKKLASIASVLSMQPDILLMDEPSASLDPKNRRMLIGLLNELDQIKLIASHDLDFLWDCCERIVLISEGRIVADGSAEEILRDEKLLIDSGLELPLSLAGR